MTFETFDEMVRNAGLRARCCSPIHWQILGGTRLVNVWPDTKRGFEVQMANEDWVSDAMTLAGNPCSEPIREVTIGCYRPEVSREDEAELPEEPQPTPRTSEEWSKLLVPLLTKKFGDDLTEGLRELGWLVEGGESPFLPPREHWDRRTRCMVEGTVPGLIRRFWRWLW